MKVLYTTTATAKGGRDGHVESMDGRLKVNLSMPKELGGPGKEGATNPEQLFGAGYAACFESAIRHIARLEKATIPELTVESEVGLIPAPTGFALTVTLRPHFTGVDTALAQSLVEKAHQVCPYSNALKGNVDVKIEIK